MLNFEKFLTTHIFDWEIKSFSTYCSCSHSNHPHSPESRLTKSIYWWNTIKIQQTTNSPMYFVFIIILLYSAKNKKQNIGMCHKCLLPHTIHTETVHLLSFNSINYVNHLFMHASHYNYLYNSERSCIRSA